jgi:hypothetical protein
LRQHYKEYLQNLEMIRECELGMDGLLRDHLSRNEIDASQAPNHPKARKKNKSSPCVDFQKYSFQYILEE